MSHSFQVLSFQAATILRTRSRWMLAGLAAAALGAGCKTAGGVCSVDQSGTPAVARESWAPTFHEALPGRIEAGAYVYRWRQTNGDRPVHYEATISFNGTQLEAQVLDVETGLGNPARKNIPESVALEAVNEWTLGPKGEVFFFADSQAGSGLVLSTRLVQESDSTWKWDKLVKLMEMPELKSPRALTGIPHPYFYAAINPANQVLAIDVNKKKVLLQEEVQDALRIQAGAISKSHGDDGFALIVYGSAKDEDSLAVIYHKSDGAKSIFRRDQTTGNWNQD